MSFRSFPSRCAARAYSGDKHALLKRKANAMRRRNTSAMRQRGSYCCFIRRHHEYFVSVACFCVHVCHLLLRGDWYKRARLPKIPGGPGTWEEKLKQIPHTTAKTPPKIVILSSHSCSNECVKNQKKQDTCHAWLMFADKLSKFLILEHDNMETYSILSKEKNNRSDKTFTNH